MENLEKEILEGKNADTSAAPEESAINLSTVPEPTEEEKIDAGLVKEPELEPEPESDLVSEPSEPALDPDPVAEPVQEPVPEQPVPAEEPEMAQPAEPSEPVIEPAEKMFTQSQVNDMIGKTRVDTRNKTFEYIYGRYGVKDEDGLDSLIGNAQRYDSLREEYDNEKHRLEDEANIRNSELAELKEKVALMESGIDRERYDDAKFILKGKGLELTAENIGNELASHPEWKKVTETKVYTPKEPVGKISVLGNEKENDVRGGETEEEIAMNKYFKV